MLSVRQRSRHLKNRARPDRGTVRVNPYGVWLGVLPVT